MNLPEEEAFRVAAELAASHPETTSFYRFADFRNYFDTCETGNRKMYFRRKHKPSVNELKEMRIYDENNNHPAADTGTEC